MAFDRSAADPNKMDGAPCIRGSRILVATIVGMVADSMGDEYPCGLPYPKPQDIREALRYAAEVVREREIPLA